MIALLISSSFLIFISAITGHVISGKFGFSPGWIEKTFLGLAISNSIFNIITLFLPLRPYIPILYFIICLTFFLFDYKNILKFSFARMKPQSLFFLSFPVIIFFGFINSLYYPVVFDSGLYHIQAIEWIEQYPAVPGLVNLHGRFGFNPNIFTLFAATSFDGVFRHEVFSVNFVFYLLFAVWLLRGINKFVRSGYFTFALMYLIALVILIDTSFIISSPTPDFACYFIPFYVVLRFVEIKVLDKKDTISSYFTIIVLTVYVITVKLAAAPLLLIIPLVIYQNWKNINRKELFIMFFLTILILVPWLIRNIVLTGWIVYPFDAIDLFGFDWKVPKSDVIAMSEVIKAWARMPGDNFLQAVHMSFSQWFPIWWTAKNIGQKILFILICSTPIIVLALILIQKLKGVMRSYQPVYFVTITGFLFWFVVAPDWRYGLPWIVLPLLTLLLFTNLSFKFNGKIVLSIVAVLAIAFTVYLNITSIVDYLNVTPVQFFTKNFGKVKYVTQRIVRKSEMGEVQFNTYMIDGKLEVKYPVDDYRCFDEELPCSSFMVKRIHLRGDDISSGFYIKAP